MYNFLLMGGIGVERESVYSFSGVNFITKSERWREVREQGGLSDILCPYPTLDSVMSKEGVTLPHSRSLGICLPCG